ncbi:ENV1 protein, partial [Tyrannus savana]|nr:ENV1 protein [Tyrannus savana]
FYEREDSLLHLAEASYRALNQTEPNMTDSCWLCYDVQPPFYEGVGLNATFKLSKENIPAHCHWHEKEIGLTMSQVSGSGTCIG